MLTTIPTPLDFDVSPRNGFLPDNLPLETLPDPYYKRWETIVVTLPALLQSGRLRNVIHKLPILSTSGIQTLEEWRRAYLLLAFMAHGYVWGGDSPAERVPPQISIPFKEACKVFELPTVATYAGVCLWNYKPIFEEEQLDDPSNLATLATFTGTLDESWFYLVSVAIEAKGAPLIPIMLKAIQLVRQNHARRVVRMLQALAEGIDAIATLLVRMYEHCEPHVFYDKIRPFLAGSKNMSDAGLPNGVIFDTESPDDAFVQFGGGSNAQSSLLQFIDLILGIEHRPTGTKATPKPSRAPPTPPPEMPTTEPPAQSFIMEMRKYMPGPHARFLEEVSKCANMREYVASHQENRALVLAYDACLAMMRTLRDKHIQMVSRYIIVKSRAPAHPAPAPSQSHSHEPKASSPLSPKVNLASTRADSKTNPIRGTGGTALISFLKQARDETHEPSIDTWTTRLLREERTTTLGSDGEYLSETDRRPKEEVKKRRNVVEESGRLEKGFDDHSNSSRRERAVMRERSGRGSRLVNTMVARSVYEKGADGWDDAFGPGGGICKV